MIPGISNNRLRYEARVALSNALKVGAIPPARLQPCTRCGIAKKTSPGARIIWHHPDYHRPLDVIALCVKCHTEVHIEESKLEDDTDPLEQDDAGRQVEHGGAAQQGRTMRHTILAYGGGTQTIAILTLIAEGRLPKPELAICADTGRERTSTWEYLDEIAGPLMDSLGIRFEKAGHELATVDLYAHNGDLVIPAYTENGKLPTYCSQEWKRQVCLRKLRQLGYGPKNPVVAWYGMSLDEVHRMKESRLQWHSHHYPLILDVPMRRIDCETQIERFGLPLPKKSACYACPHLNDVEWQDVKDNHPEDWKQAVALDAEVRANDERGGVWLHKSRVPLDEVEFKAREELPLFECAESCWT